MSQPKGALDGLRVLDISSFLAAPQVATFLGDFGAEVIKIEPPSGEALRRIGASRNGESLVWAMVSRNKRVITCDLNQPEGRDILRQLVAEVNVLVHNYSPAMLERWDCTWEQLRTLNPNLVMVSVSPYGHTGPLADRPGAGTMAEAFAGLTHMTGEADGPPMLTSIPLGDTLTGIFGLIGALVACYGRDVNGPRRPTRGRVYVRAHIDSDGQHPGRLGSRRRRPSPDEVRLPLGDRRPPQHLPHRRQPLPVPVGHDRPPGGAHPGPHRARRPRGPGQVRPHGRPPGPQRRARRPGGRLDRPATR